jgi:hypothetical protein
MMRRFDLTYRDLAWLKKVARERMEPVGSQAEQTQISVLDKLVAIEKDKHEREGN